MFDKCQASGLAAQANLKGRAPVLEGKDPGDRYREPSVGSELRILGEHLEALGLALLEAVTYSGCLAPARRGPGT